MRIQVSGADIFIQDQGTGTPILFLHGNPDTADIWDGVIAGLQKEHRCIAPDLPGFGRSTVPRDFDFAFENLGHFVNELVDAVHAALPLNLVTHDFGGAYGMAWAVQYPEKVRRIVVINHPFFIGDYRWHLWARLYRTPILGELSLMALNWGAFYWIVRYGSRRLRSAYIRRAYSFLTPEWKQMVLRLYRAAAPADFRAWEPRMRQLTAKVPTRVLWGKDDPWVPQWVAERFGAERVIYFSDCGHWAPAEVPEQVATETGTFVKA
jgi:pimeloyl-ACP methyl ester carboxylesterase